MSWQAYVDNNLVGTGKISRGAIFGHDCTPWATSPNLSIAPAETKALMAAFADPSAIRQNGLYLDGTKHIVLKTDERSIYGKAGAAGVVCVKTGKAVLVGFYDDKTVPGDATKIVESLADYLIGVNY